MCTDFLEFTSSFSCYDTLPPNSAKSWQPKKFTKHTHPLFLIVSSPVFLVLQSCCEPNINVSEKAWLLKPHEASTGDQSPGLQVEEIWPIYLLWKSLNLPHLSSVSDSFWTCDPQSCRKTM